MIPRIALLALAAIILTVACGSADAPDASVEPAAAFVAADLPMARDIMAPVDSLTLITHTRLAALSRQRGLAERSMGETVQTYAEQLLGLPYVEHMLDQGTREELVVSLAGFDCVLFVEAAVGLAQAMRAGKEEFQAFARNVESLRYRDGELVDYCSRLHYFSDWLYDNDRRGNIRLITDQLSAAVPFRKEISFMSSNRRSYRGLASDDAYVCVQGVERDLNRRSLTYVPQENIAQVYDQLQAGDIIALTSSVRGLDIAHTGLVYKHPDGGTGMIHASTTGEVRREADLARYVQSIRGQTGMMVARPLDLPVE